MNKVLFYVFLVAYFCVLAQGQLTFTSSWGGKRSVGPMMCRSDEAVAAIYRMIQNEAERLILCQKP